MNLDRLTIRLPWIDSRLMPNNKNGKSWKSFNDSKIQSKQAGQYSTLAALGRDKLLLGQTVPVKLTFVAPDNRHRDLDNMLASQKHALDGIAQALGVDDKCFRPIVIDSAVDTKKQGFVLVEIGQ